MFAEILSHRNYLYKILNKRKNCSLLNKSYNFFLPPWGGVEEGGREGGRSGTKNNISRL